MNTVLLWDHQWWLPEHEPVAFATLAEAAATLAATWTEASKVLRLVYEPAGFASMPAACPKGSRATLALALREQFPVLAQAGLAWSHEPILAAGDQFQTILHHEAEPALQKLSADLTEAGFRVTAAFPLPTWLNALPEDLSDTGGLCVAAAAPTQVCLYRHGPDGIRTVERWSGPAAPGEFGRYLHGLLSDHPQDMVLLVPTDSTVLEPINAIVPLDGRDNVHVLALDEALRRRTMIPARHPAQLLPPAAAWGLSRLMTAVSIVFFLTAAVLATLSIRERVLARSSATVRNAQLVTLHSVVAHRRANAAEIESLRRQTNQPGGVEASKLLGAMTASVPRDLVLAKLELTPGRLQARGWMAPATKTLEPWLLVLRRNLPGWQFSSATPVAGSFEVNGLRP